MLELLIPFLPYLETSMAATAAYIVVQKYTFADEAKIVERVEVGAVIAVLAYLAVLPISAVFAAGYIGVDAIQGLMTLLSKVPAVSSK